MTRLTTAQVAKWCKCTGATVWDAVKRGALEPCTRGKPSRFNPYLFELDEVEAWRASKLKTYGGTRDHIHTDTAARFFNGEGVDAIAAADGVKRRSVLKRLNRAGVTFLTGGKKLRASHDTVVTRGRA